MALTHKDISPTMRRMRIATIIFMFIYSCVMLALSINAYAQLEENVTVILDTITNWQTNTISSIEVVSDGACTSGYELAYTYTWPGTEEGCDCRDSSKQSYRNLGVTSRDCNSSMLYYGCDKINSKPSQNLFNWGEISSTGKSICVQRTSENFADIGPDQESDCPSGYLKCGTSADNVFCTQESSCPVSDVTVVPSCTPSLPTIECVKLTDNKYLKVTREDDKLPLSQFRINEYGMCYEADDHCETPGRDYFQLLRSTGSDCGGEGTSLWNKIDTTTEVNLYAANDLTSTITYLEQFNYYEFGKSGSSYNYHLYARGYVPWKIDCRDDMDDIIDKGSDLANIKTAHLVMLIFSCISFFVIGIVLTTMEVLNLCGCDLPCVSGREEEERQQVLKFRKYTFFFFKFILLPFQIWAIVTLVNTKGLIEEVAEDECSSEVMNEIIVRTSESLKASFESDVVNIVLLVVFSILACFGGRRQESQLRKEIDERKRKAEMDEEYRHPQNENPPNGNVEFQTQPMYQQQPFQQQPYQQQPYQQQPYQQQQPMFQSQQQPMFQSQQMYQSQPGFQQPMYQGQMQPQQPQYIGQPGIQQPVYQQVPNYQDPNQGMYVQPGYQQQPMVQPQQQIVISIDANQAAQANNMLNQPKVQSEMGGVAIGENKM